MEVATKLTAGLAISAPSQAADTSTAGSVETPALSGSAVPTTSGQVTPYVVGSAVPQVAYTPGEIYRDLNDQQTKVAFSAQKAEAAAPNVGRAR